MNDLITRAAELGRQHREEGIAPYGDLDDGGSASLMDALGERAPTDLGNWGVRMAACDAYTESLEG